MDIKDFFGKKEMPADEEKPNAEQYAPLYKEPEDITLFKIVRKLVELGAEFDIKACGVHITNKSTEKKGKGLHDQFSEEYDKFINATWYNSIDKTPEEGEEVRIRILTNEREMEENAVFKTNEPTGEPAFFWKTGFIKVSSCVLWRRFAKCEQTEDKE